jgi:DNA-binding CsgD family transcriptional regulator
MDGWVHAKATAGRMAPAAEWRKALAQALYQADGVAMAAVLTCPPGDTPSAQGEVAPPEMRERVLRTFLERIQPKVDRRDEAAGAAIAQQIGSRAYAPLEAAGDRQLVREVMREIVEPSGAAGLLNAFLLDRQGGVIGWMAVATRLPGSQALQILGDPLTEVATAASATLQGALELAAGVGAVAPNRPAQPLTRREKEIVRLVAQGLSDLSIAGALGITEHTVGAHLRRIFGKLDVHSRVELARAAGSLAPPSDEPPER